MRQLDGLTNAMDVTLGKLRETVRDKGPIMLQSWGYRVRPLTEQLNNKTTRQWGAIRPRDKYNNRTGKEKYVLVFAKRTKGLHIARSLGSGNSWTIFQ